MNTKLYEMLHETYQEYVLNDFYLEEFAEMKGISVDMMKAIVYEFA